MAANHTVLEIRPGQRVLISLPKNHGVYAGGESTSCTRHNLAVGAPPPPPQGPIPAPGCFGPVAAGGP